VNTFVEFKEAVQKQFNEMSTMPLFKVGVDTESLWNHYLDSFPPGTNEIYRERRSHDCQCCKQFIKNIGKVVAIDSNNEIVSVWDVNVGGTYQIVADALASMVRSFQIVDIFLHDSRSVGIDFNHQETDEGIKRWDHFYTQIPKKFINTRNIDTIRGEARTNRQTLKRSLEELTIEASEIVLELIDQNSIYRGMEHRETVNKLLQYQKHLATVSSSNRENYYWKISAILGGISNFRGTVIGTLLEDISNNISLEVAVKKFEDKVAPHNYKRTTALVTRGMVEKAQKTIEELGLADSLERRYAVNSDITINNVIFADRTIQTPTGIFAELMSEVVSKQPKKFGKVQEVAIGDFIQNVLPQADRIEVLFENKHHNNLVSLIAPSYPNAKPLFKWNNNFSWNYNGEVADSIKEKVKAAGGSVTGVLRCSLAWSNYDDLDIHVRTPGGHHIYYNDRLPVKLGGRLDVDMNAGVHRSRSPVENITWPFKKGLEEGVYSLWVHNFTKREMKDEGFVAEIEYEGEIHRFEYDTQVRNNQTVNVAEFVIKDGVLTVKSKIPEANISKETWNINSQQFHPVKMIMQSPNHWDDQAIGNKHWFFMINNCVNPDASRGFFNEFLRAEFREHRKVFEVLSSKMKAAPTKEQLSGLGFSSTKPDQLICKVKGKSERIIKVIF
jgi:hypothetical protein